MTDKKPYSAPQIFEVELNHDQAILSVCSAAATNIDDTGGREDGVNQYVSVICNPYYSSFYTNPKKNSETVAGLLSDLEATSETQPNNGEGKSLRDFAPTQDRFGELAPEAADHTAADVS